MIYKYSIRARRQGGLLTVAAIISLGCEGHSQDTTRIVDEAFLASCIGIGDKDADVSASLCVVDIDDGATRVLVEGISPGVRPALSADRRWIAVVKNERVAVLDVHGALRVTLDVSAVSLSFGTGNDTLIVQRSTEHGMEVDQIALADDREPVVLVSVSESDGEAEQGVAVSRDGTQLAYALRTGNRSSLTVHDIESGQRRIVLESSDRISWPTWSPVDTRLAVVVGERIETIDVLSGRTVKLVTDSFAVTTPTWSPTADRIAYVDVRGAVAVVSSRDGGARHLVVDLTADLNAAAFPALPTWS